MPEDITTLREQLKFRLKLYLGLGLMALIGFLTYIGVIDPVLVAKLAIETVKGWIG